MAQKKKRRRSSLPQTVERDLSDFVTLVALVKLSVELAVLKAEVAALRARTS